MFQAFPMTFPMRKTLGVDGTSYTIITLEKLPTFKTESTDSLPGFSATKFAKPHLLGVDWDDTMQKSRSKMAIERYETSAVWKDIKEDEPRPMIPGALEILECKHLRVVIFTAASAEAVRGEFKLTNKKDWPEHIDIVSGKNKEELVTQWIAKNDPDGKFKVFTFIDDTKEHLEAMGDAVQKLKHSVTLYHYKP